MGAGAARQRAISRGQRRRGARQTVREGAAAVAAPRLSTAYDVARSVKGKTAASSADAAPAVATKHRRHQSRRLPRLILQTRRQQGILVAQPSSPAGQKPSPPSILLVHPVTPVNDAAPARRWLHPCKWTRRPPPTESTDPRGEPAEAHPFERLLGCEMQHAEAVDGESCTVRLI